LLLLLILPILNKSKTRFAKWADAQSWSSYVRWVLAVGLCALAISLVNSVLSVRKYRSEMENSIGDIVFHNRIRALESELDRDLAVSAILLLIFLNRYFSLLKAHNILETKHYALERQAKGNTMSSQSLLDEKGKLENKVKELQSAKSGSQTSLDTPSPEAGAVKKLKAEKNALKVEGTQMKEENLKTKKEIDSLKDVLSKEREEFKRKTESFDKSMSALKKQAESHEKAYMNLLEINKSLQTKIDDFELVGMKSKKA